MGTAPWSWPYKEDPGWARTLFRDGSLALPGLSYLAERSLREEGCVSAAALRTHSEAPKHECCLSD